METQAVRVTGSCHKAEMLSVCMEKGFARNREERIAGISWGLAADFLSLSYMIFTLMLNIEESRVLKMRC